MTKDAAQRRYWTFYKGSKGAGLGLFISQKIISQHGGAITVASVPGHGTQFIIKIPKTALNH